MAKEIQMAKRKQKTKNAQKKRILISVTNKTDIEKFGMLIAHNWEIISTGGTAAYLNERGIPCKLIEKETGFPEMMGGRLKTLHPKIFGGILADRLNEEHMSALAMHLIHPIELVVVNLYAFNKKPGIENIDIGGPSLIRAAAKNSACVTPIVHHSDYDEVIKEAITEGGISEVLREKMMLKVFEYTSDYDRQIAKWIKGEIKAKRTMYNRSAGSH